MSRLNTVLAVAGLGAGGYAVVRSGFAGEELEEALDVPQGASRGLENALERVSGVSETAFNTISETAGGTSEGFAETVQGGSGAVQQGIEDNIPDVPDTDVDISGIDVPDGIDIPDLEDQLEINVPEGSDVGKRIGEGIVDFHRGVAEGGAEGWRRLIDSVSDGTGTDISERNLEENIGAVTSNLADRANPFKDGGRGDVTGSVVESSREGLSEQREELQEETEEVRERVSEATEDVSKTVEDTTEKARETASEATDKARETASEATENVRKGAEELEERGRKAVDSARERIGGVFG